MIQISYHIFIFLLGVRIAVFPTQNELVLFLMVIYCEEGFLYKLPARLSSNMTKLTFIYLHRYHALPLERVRLSMNNRLLNGSDSFPENCLSQTRW